MKKALKIVWRTLLALFLTVYVVVALLNYSLVQSLVASYAGSRCSEAWGGEVRIGSLGCNPLNHLVLRNVLLVSPDNDTICSARKMSFRFAGFPYGDGGLSFSEARLHDVDYHLAIDSNGLNLKHIINYYVSHDTTTKKKPHSGVFTVLVDDLILDNVTYRHDLKDSRPREEWCSGLGVDVKHQAWCNVKARMRNVRVAADNVTCRIERFVTHERSGLEVQEMSMNVYVTRSGISATNMILQTGDSRLVGDVMLDYDRWKSMGHFIDSVTLNCHFLDGSYGGMRDAGWWAEPLWGMDEQVDIRGWFGGTVSDLYAEGVRLAFGDESYLEFDGAMKGLPKIDSTFIDARLYRLHTTYADLAAVRHPAGVTLKAEKLLKQMDHIDAEAEFEGRINDFSAKLNIAGKPGNLTGDVRMAKNASGEYTYSGTLLSDGLNVVQLAPNEWLSRSGLEVRFAGRGFNPRTMKAHAEGNLRHPVVKGHRIANEPSFSVEAEGGRLAALVDMDDALGKVSGEAALQYREQSVLYTAQVDVESLDLKGLGLWSGADNEARVDGKITGRYADMGEGNSRGRVSLNGLHLAATRGECRVDEAELTVSERSYWKDMNLRSDIVDAQMRGYYEYGNIGEMVRTFLADFVPVVANAGADGEVQQTASVEPRAEIGDFELSAEWKGGGGVMEFFEPRLLLARGTSVQLNYNKVESFKPIVRSDSIGWGSLRVYDVGMNGGAVADSYRMRLTSEQIKIGNLVLSESSDVALESSHSSAHCRLYWDNGEEALGGGDVNLRLLSDGERVDLVVDPSKLTIGGELWRLDAGNGDTYIDGKGFEIGGINLWSGDQRATLRGSRRGEATDSIELVLNEFGVGVLNTFLEASGMSVDGTLDGNVHIGFLHKESDGQAQNGASEEVPYLNGDIAMHNLKFDGEELGDARLRSTWNAELNELNVYLTSWRTGSDEWSEPIDVSGYIALGGDEPELNLRAVVEGLGMQSLQPLMRSFSSEVEGKLFCELDINGTLSAPRIEGFAYVDKGKMKVDYLNVSYLFDDTVWMDKGMVRLDGFEVRDTRGGNARLDGRIFYETLSDMNFNIAVNSPRLLCMNTTLRQSEQYYGTVIASINGRVTGGLDDLDIVLNATTLEGSSLHIPINDKRELKQVDYIHFVSDRDEEEERLLLLSESESKAVPVTAEGTSGVTLTINLEATPDVRLELPMDFSTVTADVKAVGAGDLQLQVGGGKPFSLMGDLELSSGTVELDVLGLLSKEFTIDDGSSITFRGDVSDALFDIKAVYGQRVNLSTLTGTLSATDSQKPVLVENVIKLSGNLQAPEIDFDLRLPNADQSVQEEVFAYIDRNNERDMLNQTVSLLLFKKFYNSSTSTDANAGGTSAAEEGYGFVANTLGGMVSDMVDFVDINFAYQAGNALTTEQYAVDISKEWNKFYFESTFGFGGEAREMSGVGGNNNMTGDMLVGYKINPRLHLFVFNRSNTNDYTRSDLPYKQGVGLKYTRDFDRIVELLGRKEKRK